MLKIKGLMASTLLIWFSVNSAFAQDYVVTQKNKSFLFEGNKVQKIEVKRGDSIIFKNEDSVFHNIFSLSKIMTFDLGPFKAGESKNVIFNKVGKVKVECAIHPRMVIEVDVD
jgi:plastocyanin